MLLDLLPLERLEPTLLDRLLPEELRELKLLERPELLLKGADTRGAGADRGAEKLLPDPRVCGAMRLLPRAGVLMLRELDGGAV